MFQRWVDYLFGNVEVRFVSEFSLPESVQRLRDRTHRTVFSALFREAAVGSVSESRVHLQRVIPMFGNSFKPTFVGAFRQEQAGVVLEGRFTMFRSSKIFMTVWLAFALVWTVLATVASLSALSRAERQSSEWLFSFFPLIGIAFFFVGVGFVRGCWWLSRGDMVFLRSVIESALKRQDV